MLVDIKRNDLSKSIERGRYSPCPRYIKQLTCGMYRQLIVIIFISRIAARASGHMPAVNILRRRGHLPEMLYSVSTCDSCFPWLENSINAQGQMYDATDNPATLKTCPELEDNSVLFRCKFASTIAVRENYLCLSLFLSSLRYLKRARYRTL